MAAGGGPLIVVAVGLMEFVNSRRPIALEALNCDFR
jgi:hypothetical protein